MTTNQLIIKIDLDNDAFQSSEGYLDTDELFRMVKRAAHQIDQGFFMRHIERNDKLQDLNGNTCGSLQLSFQAS